MRVLYLVHDALLAEAVRRRVDRDKVTVRALHQQMGYRGDVVVVQPAAAGWSRSEVERYRLLVEDARLHVNPGGVMIIGEITS